MDQELDPQKQSAEKQYKEPVKIENAAETIKESANQLIKFGGFKVFEMAIKGSQNLNPEKKATRNIFLSDSSRKAERENLKSTLNIWLDLLTENQSVADIVSESQKKAEAAGKNLKANVKKALDATRELESSYRSVNLFFKNTTADKIKNVTFLNAEIEQLKDLDNDLFIKAVDDEFKNNYDKLDLRPNYSLLVVPGFLGSNAVVEKWARIAHECKVMMVTDFADLESPDGVMQSFEAGNFASGDIYKSNVMMTCNWLVGRGKDEEVGEEEDVHVAPSAALAGKIYSTLMSQVSAGKTFGALNEVDGVNFQLKRTEFSAIEKLGLIPMVNEYSKVLPMSAKTLFTGDNIGWQTYSVVRVFDWIMKSLFDFLNRRAFENFSVNSKRDMEDQIIRFLDKHKGPGKLIEDFKILKFEQDELQKDKVHLDIHITPYFPAKNFVIGLSGEKGDGGAKWNSAITQK